MEKTRDKLVATAARLFHERGFAATGVSTILREAGLNPGSLYHFFSSKEQLLVAVLRFYEANLWNLVLGPIEASEADPIERVFKLLEWYRGGMEQTGCRLGCPVGNLALEVSDTHPEVRPLIDTNMVNWAAGIRGWLDEAGERLPDSCNRSDLSLFVLTAMEGGLMQARAARSLEPFDANVRVLRNHISDLVAAATQDHSKGTGV